MWNGPKLTIVLEDQGVRSLQILLVVNTKKLQSDFDKRFLERPLST